MKFMQRSFDRCSQTNAMVHGPLVVGLRGGMVVKSVEKEKATERRI